MENKSLSFEEKVFLKLYKEMYGEGYDINDKSKTDEIRTIHIKGQKAIYPFSQYSIPVGDYYFEWDSHGPHSEELKLLMHGLEQNRDIDIIKEFYNSSDYGKIFSNFQQNKIDVAIKKLSAFVNQGVNPELNDTQIVRNAETISSLVYLSRVVLRSVGFKEINEELKRRKEWTSGEKNIREIWDCLAEINMVPNF